MALTTRQSTANLVSVASVPRLVSAPQLAQGQSVRVPGLPLASGSVSLANQAGSIGAPAATMLPSQALVATAPMQTAAVLPPTPWPASLQQGNQGARTTEPAESPAPEKLTQGLPEPAQIESQRAAYMKSLDEQLKRGAEVLNQQLKQQQEYLVRQGETQKRQFGLQVDQNIKQQEMELVQQHNHQLLMLQQAAQQQKVALEQQANALLMEYNQKKATEDLNLQMHQFDKEAKEAHARYTQEIQTLQTQQQMGQQQLAAQGEALAMQANLSNMQAMAAQQVATRASASLSQPMPGQRASYSPAVVVGNTPPPSYLPPVQPSAISMAASLTPRSSTAPRTGAITPVIAAGTLTPRTAAQGLGSIRSPSTAALYAQ